MKDLNGTTYVIQEHGIKMIPNDIYGAHGVQSHFYCWNIGYTLKVPPLGKHHLEVITELMKFSAGKVPACYTIWSFTANHSEELDIQITHIATIKFVNNEVEVMLKIHPVPLESLGGPFGIKHALLNMAKESYVISNQMADELLNNPEFIEVIL